MTTSPSPQPVTLYVMRLDQMHRVHPAMDRSQTCDRCAQPVGIYPSGQDALRRYGRANVQVLCNVCEIPPPSSILAPGALAERSQSVPANQAKDP